MIWYKARMNLGNVDRENYCEMEPDENLRPPPNGDRNIVDLRCRVLETHLQQPEILPWPTIFPALI